MELDTAKISLSTYLYAPTITLVKWEFLPIENKKKEKTTYSLYKSLAAILYVDLHLLIIFFHNWLILAFV